MWLTPFCDYAKLSLNVLRRLGMLIPKFYHSRRHDGIKYNAKPAGFWRRFLFAFFPYSTGDVIKVRIEITRTNDEWWEQGNLCIDPAEYYEDLVLGTRTISNDFRFYIDEIRVGEKWSRTLELKGGTPFMEPCHIRCYLELENSADLPIATIQIVSGTKLLAGIVGTAITLLGIAVAIILSLCAP